MVNDAPKSIALGPKSRELGSGSYRDALTTYLAANYSGGSVANLFSAADTNQPEQPVAVQIRTVRSQAPDQTPKQKEIPKMQ